MKIAIIIRKLNVSGGVQRHVLYLAHNLKQRGHAVKIYTFLFDKEKCFSDLIEGLEVVSLDYYPRFTNVVTGILDENKVCRELAQKIDIDTEILNPHDHVVYKVAYYFKKRRSVSGVFSVWTMHDMPTKLFSYLRKLALDGSQVSFLKTFFYKLLDLVDVARFIKYQDKIVVLDQRDMEYVKKYFNREGIIVRNGIDISRFPFVSRTQGIQIPVKLLMNGIFFPHRRFEDGIRAVSLLRDRGISAELNIYGDFTSDMNYYDTLQKMVIQLGLDGSVFFKGRVSEDALVRSYGTHDIFIFPNHLQSWGLAVFEAMASGTPVIVSKSAGAHEVLTHGENAFLVSPKSPEMIAEMVQKLCVDKNLFIKLSNQGRNFVESKISWEMQASRMEEIFKAVVQ